MAAHGTGTSTHRCAFFDDGGPDLACACGQRALYLAEEDGADAVLVLLDDGVVALASSGVTARLLEGLAVSA